MKLLKAGISFEICAPHIVVEPTVGDVAHTIFAELDSHYRHIHGIKTHPPEMARSGRKPFLDSNKLADVRAALSKPGATQAEVAQSLGVARSTLYNFLERHDQNRPVQRRTKKTQELRPVAVGSKIADPRIKEETPTE